jgi:hypothetical protein
MISSFQRSLLLGYHKVSLVNELVFRVSTCDKALRKSKNHMRAVELTEAKELYKQALPQFPKNKKAIQGYQGDQNPDLRCSAKDMEVSVKLNIFWRCTSAVSTLPQCYLFDAIRGFAPTTRCILRKKARYTRA